MSPHIQISSTPNERPQFQCQVCGSFINLPKTAAYVGRSLEKFETKHASCGERRAGVKGAVNVGNIPKEIR